MIHSSKSSDVRIKPGDTTEILKLKDSGVGVEILDKKIAIDM